MRHITLERSRPRIGLRGAALALLCAQAFMLAACGPGVGGSGTGPAGAQLDGLVAFGAQAAPACAGSAPSWLACSAPATAPADTRVWVDNLARPTLRLEVQGDALTLEARCTQSRFSGLWGTSAGSGLRYYGAYSVGQGLPVAASLVGQPGEAGTAVVQVRGIDGAILLGPITVRRAEAPVPPLACP